MVFPEDAGGATPFVIIQLVYLPFQLLAALLRGGWGVVGSRSYVLGMIFITILMEAILFTILDVISKDGTRGRRKYDIEVRKINGRKAGIFSCFLRNVFKSISRLLIFVPFLLQLFTKRHQSLHDLIAQTVVIDK